MIPTLMKEQPPFVRFEEREMGLDPDATTKEGRPIPRVVIMACITPHGSKDCVERIATDWLAQIRRQAMAGSYNLEWVRFFELQFEEWKKGNELPRLGTPVKTWPMVTAEASKRIRAAGYQTIEDLAQLPDSGLAEIGLDGRYWRDLARGWLNEAKDKGINAKALADANVRISDLEGQNGRLLERIDRLEARLQERTDAADDEEAEARHSTPRRRRGAAQPEA